jgi:hypothetical protein
MIGSLVTWQPELTPKGWLILLLIPLGDGKVEMFRTWGWILQPRWICHFVYFDIPVSKYWVLWKSHFGFRIVLFGNVAFTLCRLD